MNKYLFSVVIPIYNCEKYLDETINSIVKQTIGFKNIELILVNDGSTDNSEQICLKYKNKYKNIIYIKQENAGVAEARNKGLEIASGELINFLDSYDKWEKDVFKKVYNLFSHEKKLNIVGFQPIDNLLDYKFVNNPDGVYDITEHFNYVQNSVASSFIRTSVAKLARFDKRIIYSEDAKYLNEYTKSHKLPKVKKYIFENS